MEFLKKIYDQKNHVDDINLQSAYTIVIRLLKFLGNSPISSTSKLGQATNIHYVIEYSSYSTICAALVGCYYTCFWIIFLFDMPFNNSIISHSFRLPMTIIEDEIRNSSSSKEMGNHIVRAIQVNYISMCFTNMIIIHLSWSQASKLVEFLNKWIKFELTFRQTFPHIKIMDFSNKISTFRTRLLVFYVALPSLILGPINLKAFTQGSITWVQILFVLSGNTSLITTSLLDDVCVFMAYKILATSYEMIKQGVVQESNLNENKLTGKDVVQWRYLACFVRDQVNLTVSMQSVHQLWIFANYIVTLTATSFIVLNVPWDNAKIVIFSLASIVYSIIMMSRIYFKAVLSQNITHEETYIMHELAVINTKSNDAATILEVNFLHDMLLQNPSTISFGNCTVLNQRLLLKIFSQVLSYLVVLMQFSQAKIKNVI